MSLPHAIFCEVLLPSDSLFLSFPPTSPPRSHDQLVRWPVLANDRNMCDRLYVTCYLWHRCRLSLLVVTCCLKSGMRETLSLSTSADSDINSNKIPKTVRNNRKETEPVRNRSGCTAINGHKRMAAAKISQKRPETNRNGQNWTETDRRRGKESRPSKKIARGGDRYIDI